ncbi:hypothetical protein Anapl_08904 [Anas platyrhynchos]|uniref:Uncharacterized protein n=1 Tax=Anas platyrhynchos TaxID=8839 RepID=R0LRM8_ANAPL|nr:hypothetical protein Anapl_08904 [Anas platyrhynchos]
MQCVNITEILKSRSFRPGDESLLAVSDVSSLSQELLIVDVSVVLSTKVAVPEQQPGAEQPARCFIHGMCWLWLSPMVPAGIMEQERSFVTLRQKKTTERSDDAIRGTDAPPSIFHFSLCHHFADAVVFPARDAYSSFCIEARFHGSGVSNQEATRHQNPADWLSETKSIP